MTPPPARATLASRLATEARLLYHIALARNRGANHAERMEAYFGPQADGYDQFRERLLHGRRGLYRRLPTPEGGVWLELAGGTGQCLEYVGERLRRLEKVYVIDLSPSLLEKAHDRARRHRWTNVECCLLDVANDPLPTRHADVATFSYSLSMIPDWFAAIDRVHAVLRPGGMIGVCDFHQARKYPDAGQPRQSPASQLFWRLFFMGDDVFPNADHLPYLRARFQPVAGDFGHGRIPYLPLWAPWYRFVGRKQQTAGAR